MAKADTVFSGSIPALYDKYLGPLIFEPYAEDLAQRLSTLDAARVLEAAAGTGIVTRALLHALPGSVAIVATDLNQPRSTTLPRRSRRAASPGKRPMRNRCRFPTACSMPWSANSA